MCIYMYISVYVCIYLFSHTCVCTHVHIPTHISNLCQLKGPRSNDSPVGTGTTSTQVLVGARAASRAGVGKVQDNPETSFCAKK